VDKQRGREPSEARLDSLHDRLCRLFEKLLPYERPRLAAVTVRRWPGLMCRSMNRSRRGKKTFGRSVPGLPYFAISASQNRCLAPIG
jgi:hypothetical protein